MKKFTISFLFILIFSSCLIARQSGGGGHDRGGHDRGGHDHFGGRDRSGGIEKAERDGDYFYESYFFPDYPDSYPNYPYNGYYYDYYRYYNRR